MTCDPKDVAATQNRLQENIYYTGDVMVRGEYPYFAKRIWKEYGVELDITEQDREDLKNGTVDMITYSYYCTSCCTTHEVTETAGGNLNMEAQKSLFVLQRMGMEPGCGRFEIFFERILWPLPGSDYGSGKWSGRY